MKISPINQNRQPSFKQISIVQISKKAFKNPDKVLECHETFSDALAKIAIKEPEKVDLLTKLGLKMPPMKFMSTVEYPSHTMGRSLTIQYPYSLNWFRQNSGYNFKNPMNPEAHSFIVFTKKDQSDMMKFASRKTTGKLMQEAKAEINQREQKGEIISEFALTGLFAKKLDDMMSGILEKKEVKNFQIDSLDKLEELAEKLDI